MSRARKIKKAARSWVTKIVRHDGFMIEFVDTQERWARFERLYERRWLSGGWVEGLWPGMVKYGQCKCCKPRPNPKPRRGNGDA